MFLRLASVMLIITGSTKGSTVKQTPLDLIKTEGEPAVINCSHNMQTHDRILWYKQLENKELSFMGYLLSDTGNTEPQFKSKIGISGKANKLYGSLTLIRSYLDSSAVYFCAAYNNSYTNPAVFGSGTRLTVLDPQKEIRHPNITVLKPNATEECKKKRVTLVCMITNFYPDHVKVSWYSNGVEKTGGVATDSAATHEDDQKTYKISSRLSIDHKEWKRGRTYRCTVTFYNGTGYTDWSAFVNGPQDDGVYKAKVNIAFLGYIASLGKSAVYGFFIMFIVMRKYFVSK